MHGAAEQEDGSRKTQPIKTTVRLARRGPRCPVWRPCRPVARSSQAVENAPAVRNVGRWEREPATLAEVRDAAGHVNVSITSSYLHVAVDDEGAVGNLFQ
jgi:hypothetical protein